MSDENFNLNIKDHVPNEYWIRLNTDVLKNGIDYGNVRWFVCTIPSELSASKGIKLREHLLWSAIRLRNKLTTEETSGKLAERLNLDKAQVSRQLKKLRANGLVHPEKLIAIDNAEFLKKSKTGSKYFLRFPIPTDKCPLSFEGLAVLALLAAFPEQQSIRSIAKRLGIKWKTVAKQIEILKTQKQSLKWFAIKEENFEADDEKALAIWIRKNKVASFNQSELLTYVHYYGFSQLLIVAGGCREYAEQYNENWVVALMNRVRKLIDQYELKKTALQRSNDLYDYDSIVRRKSN